MNNKNRAVKISLLLLAAILPAIASAANFRNSPRASLGAELSAQIKSEVCLKLKSNPTFVKFSLPLPPFCAMTTPPSEPLPPPIPLPTPEPEPEPEPKPTVDHLIISEVYYRGSSGNEWIEIHNNTGSPVVMEGWTISDANSNDILATTTILNRGFAIITGSTTLSSTISIPEEVQIIVLSNSTIGSGLNNPGDAIYLKNGGAVVDSMSYGTNLDVFNPSAPAVVDGHSIGRINLTTDTDTASDWQDNAVPNPGSI